MTTTVGAHRFRYVAPPANPSPGALWDYFARQNDEIARAVNAVRSVADGGTGTDTFVAGDLLVSTAANALSRLAIGATSTVLTVVAGLPAWAALSLNSLSDVNITSPATSSTLRYDGAFWVDTTVLSIGTADVTLSGQLGFTTAITQVVPGATSLSFRNNADSADNLIITNVGNVTIRGTLAITGGALGIASGGTSFTTYTLGDLLYASATNVLSKRGIGATNDVLTVIGGVPTWQAAAAGATTLDGLTDVTITAVADEQTLRYNSGTAQWINNSILKVGAAIVTATGGEFRIDHATTSHAEFYLGGVRKAGIAVTAADIFRLTDNAGALKMLINITGTAAKIVPPSTSIAFRNNADSADNFSLTDAGVAVIRDLLTVKAEKNAQVTWSTAAASGTKPDGTIWIQY